ncbi:O-acetyl-ADP-ribose deacetylase [Hugenholtzia roseola]|uniref:O-acetyl-ADP-ribose deacetylase n=1 Tax=Hugenholtzia roseola TaxID=1002 RepID=UPI0003FEFCED|nr:O-acetyl-ADP-ribose deacetylase [Hugenholtzia roseola]
MKKITLQKGDITKLAIPAIVNAANRRLAGGGGVDGAIHLAAGREMILECDKIRDAQGGCPTGSAVLTKAGNLPCQAVIHAVGPIWSGGKNKEAQLLASAYRQSLALALENNLLRIAFPNISTGVYGFPKPLAAEIAIKTVEEFLDQNPTFEEVIFICFDDENYTLYQKLLG